MLDRFIQQSEYQRGVSAWHFDIEDLKAQASLVKFTVFFLLNFHYTLIALLLSYLSFQIYEDEPSETKEDDVAARIIESEKVL